MFVTIKCRVYTDASGVYTEIPALLTPAGLLEPLLDFCLYRTHDRSIEWMRKVTRAARLFLEYLQSNPDERATHRLFQNFAQRLYTGTFDLKTGLDPSGLCWRPRSADDAGHIIANLTEFFDWLSELRPVAAEINPRYAGSAYDRMTYEAAYQYRRDKAFLGHTWAENAVSGDTGHRVRKQRAPKVETGEPPAFPEDRFMDLLSDGFKVAGRYDYRGMLITLLLNGAGFRESEPFHLFIDDIVPDPTNTSQALVHIHHPTLGAAPGTWRDARGKPRRENRMAYLGEAYGLVPRTKRMDSLAAGWKGGTHDGAFYKRAYWFLPERGELFLDIWYRYLDEVARINRHHPFAFVNLRREPLGAPYTLAKYLNAHEAACKRIGLQVAKSLGTTPHGHRHAYGRRLMKAGISKELIRRFMHHASLESQEVYTQGTTRENMAALEVGAQRLRDSFTGNSAQQFSTLAGLSI